MSIAVGLLSTELVRDDLDAVLAAHEALGVSAVQLNLGSAVPAVSRDDALKVGMPALGPHLRADLAEPIGAAARAHGIDVVAIDGTFNMVHPAPAHRAAGLAGLETTCAIASALGVRVITLSTGTRDAASMWTPNPANASDEAWDDLLDTMGSALDIGGEHDLVLAFEPEINNVASSPAVARRLLDAFANPRLRVIMDPANIVAEGALPRMRSVLDEAFELLGGDIALAHAKDLDRDGTAGKLPAGLGLLDYPHYLGLLRRCFDGALILHALTSLPEAEYPARLDFVRALADG